MQFKLFPQSEISPFPTESRCVLQIFKCPLSLVVFTLMWPLHGRRLHFIRSPCLSRSFFGDASNSSFGPNGVCYSQCLVTPINKEQIRYFKTTFDVKLYCLFCIIKLLLTQRFESKKFFRAEELSPVCPTHGYCVTTLFCAPPPFCAVCQMDWSTFPTLV